MSAGGVFVPPVFICKRKNMNDRLLRRAPYGTVGVPSASGWIDVDIFVRYLLHFIQHVKPSETNKCIIDLDGHISHKSMKAIDLARQNNVTLVTLPPHTSYRLQPLDITLFRPQKTTYYREMDKWMLAHPIQRITGYDICESFNPAYTTQLVLTKRKKVFNQLAFFLLIQTYSVMWTLHHH